MKIDNCHELLKAIEKSNLTKAMKMKLAMLFGFLHGIDEVMYVDESGKYF